MASHVFRNWTVVLMVTMATATTVHAQPACRVAVDDMNAAAGVLDPGHPAQPGVEVETVLAG